MKRSRTHNITNALRLVLTLTARCLSAFSHDSFVSLRHYGPWTPAWIQHPSVRSDRDARRMSLLNRAQNNDDPTALNGNSNELVHIQTSTQEWVPTSKANTVLRRRVFRYGPQESGRVSSVVEYKPGASFPSHPHPQGEEILVLDGTFSDWRGDHRKGTFLLNPEGFEHAPKSEKGCLLFVRLRQFPGSDRPQKALDTNEMEWDGNGRKILMDASFDDAQYLQRVQGGLTMVLNVPEDGLELFVVQGEGRLQIGSNDVAAVKYDWVRVPRSKGEKIEVNASGAENMILLVKENTLRSAFAEL